MLASLLSLMLICLSTDWSASRAARRRNARHHRRPGLAVRQIAVAQLDSLSSAVATDVDDRVARLAAAGHARRRLGVGMGRAPRTDPHLDPRPATSLASPTVPVRRHVD